MRPDNELLPVSYEAVRNAERLEAWRKRMEQHQQEQQQRKEKEHECETNA